MGATTCTDRPGWGETDCAWVSLAGHVTRAEADSFKSPVALSDAGQCLFTLRFELRVVSNTELAVQEVVMQPCQPTHQAMPSMSSVFGEQIELPGARCVPPVPLFDGKPSSEGDFSICLARQCIQANLSDQSADNEDRGKHGASVRELRLRPAIGAKGVRKRKAQPTRSDDGCDIPHKSPPPSTSTDQLFLTRISQAMVHPVGGSEDRAAGRMTRHGLTRQQAILASETRRQKGRASKHKYYKPRAAIVSGILVHLKPVTPASAGRGSHGALLRGLWQTEIAV